MNKLGENKLTRRTDLADESNATVPTNTVITLADVCTQQVEMYNYCVDSELTFHIIIQEPSRFLYDTLNGCWFLAYVTGRVQLNIISIAY